MTLYSTVYQPLKTRLPARIESLYFYTLEKKNSRNQMTLYSAVHQPLKTRRPAGNELLDF